MLDIYLLQADYKEALEAIHSQVSKIAFFSAKFFRKWAQGPKSCLKCWWKIFCFLFSSFDFEYCFLGTFAFSLTVNCCTSIRLCSLSIFHLNWSRRGLRKKKSCFPRNYFQLFIAVSRILNWYALFLKPCNSFPISFFKYETANLFLRFVPSVHYLRSFFFSFGEILQNYETIREEGTTFEERWGLKFVTERKLGGLKKSGYCLLIAF